MAKSPLPIHISTGTVTLSAANYVVQGGLSASAAISWQGISASQNSGVWVDLDQNKPRLEQVRQLVAAGITSPTKIAKALGSHPSYASTLLKKLKNEQP